MTAKEEVIRGDIATDWKSKASCVSEQGASGTLGRPLMQKGVIADNSSHYWRVSGEEASTKPTEKRWTYLT